MLRSNILKTVPYPDEFTEEDKVNYNVLYAQAKLIHADVERDNPFIIHTAIISHIRQLKGMSADFTDEELQTVRASYNDYSDPASKIVKCEEAEDHYIYDKEKNPIYFPTTLTIESDESDKKVVLDSRELSE
jgi:hypothetical protein